MPAADRRRNDAKVVVVSAKRETLADLEGYLRGVGIDTSSARDLGVLDELAASVLAIVIFPDGYASQKVVATVRTTLQRRTAVLPVLVTSEPRRYEELLANTRVLILPRMVWAWTILDAVRAHVATDCW